MKLIDSGGVASKLLIVGDFPTQNEYNTGNSFSGSAGALLNNLFQPWNYNPRNVYKTYYFKVPITGYASPNKKIKALAIENVRKLENWDQIFKNELDHLNPNVILSMGELALQNLTEEKVISKWRGSILHLHPRFGHPNVKVVPVHSPREIWEQNSVPVVYTQWDCGKAVRMMEFNERYSPKETIWIAENASSISNWWNRAWNGEFLTLDIETHHGFITCIGFSHDGQEAFSIPFLVGPSRDYSERGNYYKLTNQILRSKLPKVNQNIKYDWSVLENYGFDINNIIGDTMLMAHTIYPELPKGLDFLNSIYTDLPYYKDEGKKFDPRLHSFDRLLKYNARDALCTWQIWKCQLDDAEALKVKHFYFEKVHPTFFIYKKMDQYGVRVDDTVRKSLIQKYEPKLYDLCQTINLVAEENINPLSPTQVGRFVYEILGCPKKTHFTDSGKESFSTDIDTLEDLYVNQISDTGRKTLLRSLIVARKLSKILQFLRSPISPDGRMRTSYKLHGTETGRTSAGKSIEPYFEVGKKGKLVDTECGGSFQTIPKHGYEFGPERIGDDLRSIFVPSPGYCFVEGDQGQAEDRIVCVLAEDWQGLEVLNKRNFKYNRFGLKDDRHTLTAMMVTSKEFEQITEDDRQNRGKKPRHAGNYNASSGMLAIFTHLPFGECRRIMDRFHGENPKVRGVFHEGIKKVIQDLRYLITPHERRRDFFGLVNDAMYRVAFANIPQATVSDHNKFTILGNLVKVFPEPVAIPLAESHDSLTFEVLLERREEFMESFRTSCEMPINFSKCSLSRDYNLVIPADVKWSDTNWREMKK